MFRQVRYHEAGILEFEHRSAQHLMTLLGINREFKPADVEVGDELDVDGSHYLSTKEIAAAASLPIHLFRDQAERERKCVPHLMLVGNLRFSLPASREWKVLEALKDGRALRFGDALLHDDGIALVKRKFLGSNQKVRCSWGQVRVWNANGSFCIGVKDDRTVFSTGRWPTRPSSTS